MKDFEEKSDIEYFDNVDNLDFREEFERYFAYWRWFLVSIFLAFGAAFLYLKYTPNKFSASAYIMIKDNLKSGVSDEFKAISDLGIVGNSSLNNPENEVFIIKSRKIVGRMVDSLELNIKYFVEGSINNIEAYKSSGIKLEFLDKNLIYKSLDTSFVVSIQNNDELLLKDVEGENLEKTYFDKVITSKKIGKFKILRDELQELEYKDILVTIKPRKEVISNYASKIDVTALSEFSSILHLQVTDFNKAKTEDILDELIRQYNIDALIDKNVVSQKTITFIEDRLFDVGRELGVIQDSLKVYKDKFQISGYSGEIELAFELNSKNQIESNKLQTQLSLINWIQNEIAKQLTKVELLPNNLGISDEGISNSINEFNKLVLQKEKMEGVSGEKNPNMVILENRIDVTKSSLIKSLNNLEKSIKIQLDNAKSTLNESQNKIKTMPSLERGMIDIQRQKAIYSELYSYLLKKKEETSISLAVTVPNAKIIDSAFSSGNPVSPNRKIIYLGSILVGLVLPIIIIYLKSIFDVKIHNRKDIEGKLSIPYLGDIPHSEFVDKVIVKNNTRTSSAEGFRILRTNLNFILPKNTQSQKGKVIFVTSTISGEGKSFVSLNLASTIALTNKKVLLVGLDLRAPKITDYLEIENQKGLTNYILDDNLTIDDIKFTLPEINNVDFIVSGLIPPNPSELLLDKKVQELFETVRNDYDYIIGDTAPVSLVTDTLLIADLADVFLYVARANYLDKRMLVVPDTLHKENKLPKMAIVLNDTYRNRGYGYGYGYVEKEKKPFYKKILGI